MTPQLSLDIALLDALRAEAALSPLLAELCAAARHGNVDRMADVANAARSVGDALTSALALVYSRAAEQSAAHFDAAMLHQETGLATGAA